VKKVINWILSVMWKVFFILFMFICLLALPLFLILKLFLSPRRYRRAAYWAGKVWGKVTVFSTGSRVIIEGRENIPQGVNLCFMGNHQGFFDIPCFLGFTGRPVGFIAKQELFNVPVLGQWMREIGCVFIDRKSPRKAIETFRTSAQLIRSGHPLVIFPEGTRSKSDSIGEFHTGSLKLASMADAVIVPFAIKGTWRIYEIDKNIHPIQVRICILPPIMPNDPDYNDKHVLADKLARQIRNTFESM
jgi:1-acyl-sn-glycerol-3-phosphate acyltransferase